MSDLFSSEQLNIIVYNDVLNMELPSFPSCVLYMERYYYWRNISLYPEDNEPVWNEDNL